MPTKRRVEIKKARIAARAKIIEEFGPPPLWVRLGDRYAKGNLWCLYHPSIQEHAKSPEAKSRLEIGLAKGRQKAAITRHREALRKAMELHARYKDTWWYKRGGTAVIARSTKIPKSTVRYYMNLLNEQDQ